MSSVTCPNLSFRFQAQHDPPSGDIHCVRDAVIRGDRTIIKNLEKATKISNDNMKKMVEWSTEAKEPCLVGKSP